MTPRAGLFAFEHACITCAALPVLPDDQALVSEDVEYRPRTPRPAPHGGPRSRRCATHHREHRRAGKARARVARKSARFRLTPALLLGLWLHQGGACPCGAKADPHAIPAGVCLDHDHELAATHDHPDDEGCVLCVTGYLCPACNRDIVGRLTGRRFGNRVAGRAGAAAALRNLAAFLDDPPLARLLAACPDLLDTSTTNGRAA